MDQQLLDFDGETYDAKLDRQRLNTALGKVYTLMRDGEWRTLREIAAAVECSEAGASARLRDLRKERIRAVYPNGGVERQRCGESGTWRYRVKI